MPNNLLELEQKRSRLLTGLAQLGDLRPGSVTGILRRCGKPTCHCARLNDAGHGPTLRLTYKLQGKTISEALPTPASVRKSAPLAIFVDPYAGLSGVLIEMLRGRVY